MSVFADSQTLEDLNLTGRYSPHSVYSLFNRVHTKGGERLLEAMFRQPMSGVEEINRRSGVLQYFGRKALHWSFDKEEITAMEDYMNNGGGEPVVSGFVRAARMKLAGVLMRDEGYGLLEDGVTAVIAVLRRLGGVLSALETDGPYGDEVTTLKGILGDRRLAGVLGGRAAGSAGDRPGVPSDRLTLVQVVRYDHLFRRVLRTEMEMILQGIYRLDVHIAVSEVARVKGFSYALARERGDHVLRVGDVRHPALDKGVGNSLSLYRESNMLFLTGANMAGKSTFMKAFGIAVYLAHMGFPVAAAEMEFSLLDGIYSSINVPDNLSLGYSHFYAEVLRVKTVAEAVSEGKSLLVIFDELFKGTNVKDAYDATLVITEAFSAYPNCFFILSTHITEVGEALRERCVGLQYAYLPTVMEGNIPRYTYRMTEGITNDRHGMLIIRNERILEIIQS